MTSNLAEHISNAIKSDFTYFGELKYIARKYNDNPVILEGSYAGFHDSERLSGYIRYREQDNDHQYQRITGNDEVKKMRSCGTDGEYVVAVQLRLVISHKFKNEEGLEAKVRAALLNTDWDGYSGEEKEIEIILESSTTNKEFIYFEETVEKEEGDNKMPPEHVNFLLIDFSIGYRINVCNGTNFNENECL